MAAVVIEVAEKKYLGPEVNVMFHGMSAESKDDKKVGTNAKQKIIAGPVKFVATTNAKAIIAKAASDRFHLDEEDTFDLSDARLFHSAAIALKPQRLAKAGVEEVLTLVEQTAEEAPTEGLENGMWLHVEMPIKKLASARAKAADALLDALKTEAQVQGITFSDTKFAALMGKQCCTLTKALERPPKQASTRQEPTPADGKFVMEIEEKIRTYRADLPLLKRDLQNIEDANKLVRHTSLTYLLTYLLTAHLLTYNMCLLTLTPSVPSSVSRTQAKEEAAKTSPAPPAAPPGAPDAVPPAVAAGAPPDADDVEMAQPAGAATTQRKFFGKAAELYITTFLGGWVAAKDDRPQRLRIIAAIRSGAETEEAIDDSWWTDHILEVKIKGLAAAAARKAKAAA